MESRFSRDLGGLGMAGPALVLTRDVMAARAGEVKFSLVFFVGKSNRRESTIVENNNAV